MALKDRLDKKSVEDKVDQEIEKTIVEDSAKSAKKAVKSSKPYEGDVTMAAKPAPEAVSDEEGTTIIENVLTGLSGTNASITNVEDAVKTLITTGGLHKVKDLLSQINKPQVKGAQFGDKWADYPVCRVVALKTVNPNPSVSKFRVGGNAQDSFVVGAEFDVPLPVGRHLAEKGVAAILSVSE